MRLGARRFVPAETLDEIVPIFRAVNAVRRARGDRAVRQLRADARQVEEHEREYARQIVRLAEEGLDANVGLKLTHLGVRFDHELMFESVAPPARSAPSATACACASTWRRRDRRRHARPLPRGCARAAATTSASCCRATCTGTPRRPRRAAPARPNVRLVKGAYLEPAEVAFQEQGRRSTRPTSRCWSARSPTARTRRSPRTTRAMIEAAIEIVEREGITRDRFEFQMLYGIARAEHRSSLAARASGARRDAVGPDVVPLPDAPAGRAARRTSRSSSRGASIVSDLAAPRAGQVERAASGRGIGAG